MGVKRIEINFAIEVELSDKHHRMLNELIQDIAIENTPDGMVHWLFGQGSKPRWSRADRRFMGLPDDPNAPETGEPTWDSTILEYETSCQPKRATAPPRIE